ncbi:methylated-DNA--[protein]-cysteine S-methyltransferase [Xylella taiwanensis]|uniref:Methylated-DNA--protein-cysteine methyltransferase n=1 Tax=Xylella taiwanensis TaxID=1444770 RepID=Z9JHR0_9GAMM|nr:methylated-DNA--[protein]-cysteine S-methyltransferase [Xylella taiwanensis]AXI84289.1 cysteine methyltransferase [Xylella taiwanensis]EWS77719.1 methylated-DNA--protein-cysteine methyltransferase [Xylella taiwanensis]MCD8457404.1 methylated-DNA--[protein]-cysteine S-methyltransferase [Xylella taiwanensis]MCD8457562.1 methylated-DNA--[protein]-cysteine S-methyltransferase [Xylella taiwanensis]MCD8461314.1 methylated-DNA--[protein]-cysteine S-methyltransferase [Xylella taiwanensis]
MSPLCYDIFDSPIGMLTIVADTDALCHVMFPSNRHTTQGHEHWHYAPDAMLLQQARTQLLEYLHGERHTFALPLRPRGTPFQCAVWHALTEISFGQTWSYAQLAAHVGRPGASRAVGATNARNPLPIVLPCHRVIGSNGALTGFNGGLATKHALLCLEGIAPTDTHKAVMKS